jgi:ribonuclease PH
MNLVMTGTGEYIEVQGSGEEATFTGDQLTAMLAHGKKGVDELVQLQKAAIDAA